MKGRAASAFAFAFAFKAKRHPLILRSASALGALMLAAAVAMSLSHGQGAVSESCVAAGGRAKDSAGPASSAGGTVDSTAQDSARLLTAARLSIPRIEPRHARR